MADTISLSAALSAPEVIGTIREIAKAGSVLLKTVPTDGNKNTSNPTEFGGIRTSAEAVNAKTNSAHFSLHVGYGSPGGYRRENGFLPAPADGEYANLSEHMRRAYDGFTISGPLLQSARAKASGSKDSLTELMERTMTRCQTSTGRAAFGDGSGVVAVVRTNEAAAQTVIDVDTTVNLRGGEYIDGITLATGVVIEPARKVVAVDADNRTITVSPALTTGLTATTDGWVIASPDSTIAAPNNSYQAEIPGLAAMVSATGVLHNLSPAVVAQWAAFTEAAGGATLDETRLDAARNRVGYATGMDEAGPNGFLHITTRGVRSGYAASLDSKRQIVNSQKLQGGYDGVLYGDKAIYVDDFCRPGDLFGVRPGKLVWAQQNDWDWMKEDGAILRKVPRMDAYEATLFVYHTFMTTHRAAHFRLTGLDDRVY